MTKTIGEHLTASEIGKYLNGISKKIGGDLLPTPVAKITTKNVCFKLDTDLSDQEKKIVFEGSQVVGPLMPTIHNDKSVSCIMLTEKGIFPTNRKRVAWSDTIIFEDNQYKIIANSLVAKKNKKTGKMEEQSTNQNDLDVLYAILSYFSEVPQGKSVRIKLSSIRNLLGLKGGGKQREWIKKAINRIDGLQLTVLDKKDNQDIKVSFFEEPTPAFEYDGTGKSQYVTIKLGKYLFDQLKKNPLFIPLGKRGMIKSLIGKWLFSYVCSRLPKPYDITITESIKRSGHTGRRCDFVFEIKNALKKLRQLEICVGFVSSKKEQKICFIDTKKIS